MKTLSDIFNPVQITRIFFIASIIFPLISIYQNPYNKKTIKSNWQTLLFLLITNFLFKCPFNFQFFQGLEYEDSYIYKVAARFILDNKSYSYLTTSCVLGSLKDCYTSATYSAHVIGYPVIINLIYELIGYHPDIANILSLIFSSLSVVIVFMISKLMISDTLAAIISSFVYITIPIFNVFASTSFAELTSNFYMGLLLLLYLSCVYFKDVQGDEYFVQIINYASLFFIMGFIVLIKRDNIAILICLPLCTMIHLCLDKQNIKIRELKRNFLKTLPIIVVIILFYLFIIRVIKTVQVEDLEIGQRAFSVSYLTSLMPIFIKSLFKWKWYLFYSSFLLIGYIAVIKNRIYIFPAIIFLCYLSLYTVHYRSYYFIKESTISPFETIRYMMNTISFYSLVVGLGIYELTKYLLRGIHQDKRTMVFLFIIISSIAIGITTICSTNVIRSSLTDEEYFNRVRPIKKVLNEVGAHKSFIITSKPLLFQIYGSVHLNIIDQSSIGVIIPTKTIDELVDRENDVYLLMDKVIATTDRERYPLQYQYIDSKEKNLFYSGNNFNLYKLLNMARP